MMEERTVRSIREQRGQGVSWSDQINLHSKLEKKSMGGTNGTGGADLRAG